MLHVDHVIADRQVAKVGDERRRLRLRLPGSGPRRHVGFVGEVVGAEDHQVAIRQADPARDRAAHDHRRAHIARQVAGFVVDLLAARVLGAAAQPVGLAVLAQQAGQPLHFALVRRHQQHPRFLLRQRLELLQKRGNRTVEAQRRPGREGDLAQRVDVLIQHIHRAELVHVQAG